MLQNSQIKTKGQLSQGNKLNVRISGLCSSTLCWHSGFSLIASSKLWPVIRVSDTLQRFFFVVCNLLKHWHITWTGQGEPCGSTCLYSFSYKQTLSSVHSWYVSNWKSGSRWSCLIHEVCRSEAELSVVIDHLQCMQVCQFPFQFYHRIIKWPELKRITMII